MAKKESQLSVPPGGLLIYEMARKFFASIPLTARGSMKNNGSAEQPAPSLETEKTINLSPNEAEGSLLRRVEPKYPDEARLQHVQGTVILDVQIGTDGKVQDMQVVSGPPLLAQASTDAIKQ